MSVFLLLSSAFRLQYVAYAFVLPPTSMNSIKFGVINVGDRRSAFPLQAANTTIAAATTTCIEDDFASILSQADPTVDAPLPPAFTECPFNGLLQGPKSFYRTASKALQSPPLFSFVHKNQAMVEVSGGSNVRKLLNQEFTSLSSNAVAGISQIVCGKHSLRTARDKAEHKALRDLVGVPLSAKAVAASIPKLEEICQRRIQDMVLGEANSDSEGVVKLIDLTQLIALDITWQQVLGLDLQTKEEIGTFHEKAHVWLRGIYAKPGSPEMEMTMMAREYLVHMIEKKIEQLKESGESDGSTIGGLMFATMEEGNNRTLSKDEVIDNALLLILAATEITSSTMANVLLLMGLHPDVWQRVADEQKTVMKCHESFTKDVLEHEFPYLEAVMKETMRILPVSLVSRRETTETIMLDDDYQIPKGWGVSYNIFLTHQQEDDGSSNGMDLITDFQPSRWLNTEARPKMVDYIPFGAGPRKCPGIILAMTEMKIFLSQFARSVQNYELVMNVDEDKPIDEQIAWKQLNAVPIPEDGVEIRILS